MNKRLVWLAPIALAVLLSGCQVTVTMLSPTGPRSLVDYKLELTNGDSGGPLMRHDSSVTELPVERTINYYFWDVDDARNPRFRDLEGKWTYTRRGDTGTVRIVFERNRRTHFITTCDLTFGDDYTGTHRCEFEDKDIGTIDMEIVRFGWGEGTFELEKL